MPTETELVKLRQLVCWTKGFSGDIVDDNTKNARATIVLEHLMQASELEERSKDNHHHGHNTQQHQHKKTKQEYKKT